MVPRTRVQEVAGSEPGVRVFVVDSDGREQYERRLREQAVERVREELRALQQRVRNGKLKQPEKIGAAARILQRRQGHRYFDWEWRDGEFHYFEHAVNFAREKVLEGKYVVQTEESDLTPLEAVTAYKQLNEVERGFAHLKGLLAVRPVYHRQDERVRAYILVAALAFLLDRGPGEETAGGKEFTVPAGGVAGAGDGAPGGGRGRQAAAAVCDPRQPAGGGPVLLAVGLTPSELNPPTPPRRARKPSCSDQNRNPSLCFQ